MTQTKLSANSYSFTSTFNSIPGSYFSGTGAGPVYDVYPCALEPYFTKTHSMDYPAGTMTCSNANLKFAGNAPAVKWTAVTWHNEIRHTDIITKGLTAAKFVIHNPTPFKLIIFCTNANLTGSCDTGTYPSAASVPLASDSGKCLGNLPAPFVNSISSVKALASGYASPSIVTKFV